MLWDIWNKFHGPTIFLYNLCFGQAAEVGYIVLHSGIITAFDVDRRLQEADQSIRCWFGKDGHIINAGKSRQYFGPFHLRHQWPSLSLESACTFVAVQAENKKITQAACFLQVTHMAQVKQVEAAIGEDGPLSCLLTMTD